MQLEITHKWPGIYVICFDIVDFNFLQNELNAFIVFVQAMGALEILRAVSI